VPTLPPRSPHASHWSLDPGVVFLNHGSFGAAPLEVQAEQSRWRDRLEREPVSFFVEEHEGLMDRTRRALGEFLKCPWDSLALLPNATIAVSTILANHRLEPGDEVIFSAHEYPACQNALRHRAARLGAAVIPAQVPFPITSPDEVVAAYLAKVTPRTRLALVSHVTSPTALVLPVERLVRELESRGVATIVDGAHAPGMVPNLDLGRLRPAYYTANCHKWLCTPKGTAFLYVRPDLRDDFRPLALSNNAERPRPGRHHFLTEFDYQGTQDYTGFYSIPKALEVMGAMLPGGWPAVMAANHGLCVAARAMLCEAWGVRPPAPEAMLGSTATIILPPHDEPRRTRLAQRPTRYHDALQDALLSKWKVQVPVWGLPDKPDRFLRISAQLYNSMEQYEYLAGAVRAELQAERAL
jgi:isopenicillin-N epimerase